MIVGTFHGNVFRLPFRHVAFVVGTDGKKIFGFAEEVASSFWSELENREDMSLCEALTTDYDGKMWYALCAHQSHDSSFKQTPSALQVALNNIEVADSEVIVCVMPNPAQALPLLCYPGVGASQVDIMGAMAESSKKICCCFHDPEFPHL